MEKKFFAVFGALIIITAVTALITKVNPIWAFISPPLSWIMFIDKFEIVVYQTPLGALIGAFFGVVATSAYWAGIVSIFKIKNEI